MDTQADMTPTEYSAAIKAMGYTQHEFARILGAKPRTGQYWATVSVPPPVALIVRLLQARPEMRDVIEGLNSSDRKARKAMA